MLKHAGTSHVARAPLHVQNHSWQVAPKVHVDKSMLSAQLIQQGQPEASHCHRDSQRLSNKKNDYVEKEAYNDFQDPCSRTMLCKSCQTNSCDIFRTDAKHSLKGLGKSAR